MTDYTQLITSEHRKPKFQALVEAITQPWNDTQDVLFSFPDIFYLFNATKIRLDILGIWIGLSRNIQTPLNVYFSLDTDLLGFNQGSWKGPFDPAEGIVSLDDATYLKALLIKIQENRWDGTIESWQAIMDSVFHGTNTRVFMADRQDMSFTVCFAGARPSAILIGLIKQGILMKPAGVRIKDYIASSVESTPIFGFDVQNSNISGFDTGSWSMSI